MRKVQPTDAILVDLLREQTWMTIAEMAEKLQITATAVRQRLGRLMESGLVRRKKVSEGRGRPSHQYALTDLGRRESGANFADLAVALWAEVRAIPDPELRKGLLKRIASRMADSYGVSGKTVSERMRAIADLFGERQVPLTVHDNGGLPILTANCCPYPTLAEQDRSVCAMEKMMFSEMVGETLNLSECRLDGGTCCTFELSNSN